MKIFLDTADPAEALDLARLGILDGITTTPTFFRRLGVTDVAAALRLLADSVAGEIHVEALGQGADEIAAAAEANFRVCPRIVSKIPMGPAGLEATQRLRAKSIPVNLHLVFSANQALLAAKAGAAYVCPLVGRMNDAGMDGMAMLSDIVRIFAAQRGLQSVLMGSSIRSPSDVWRLAQVGVPAITVPPKILRLMLTNSMTEKAAATLFEDMVESSYAKDRMRGNERLPTLPASSLIREAALEMTLQKVGLVAVTEAGKVVGIVTDGDLRRALRNGRSILEGELRLIMNTSPKTVLPSTPSREVLDLMTRNRITEVLVQDQDGKALGYVSLHDLIGRVEQT